MTTHPRLGVAGLGAMGSRMAANLIEAGQTLTVWSRTPGRADALVARGAELAASPADLAERCDAVLTCVADDQAAREVYLGKEGLLSAARVPSLSIDTTTMTPALARELGTAAQRQGVHYLDAPMLGSTPAAETAQLFFLVGGDAEVYRRARAVLDVIGRGSLHAGPQGAGAAVKLLNNMVVACLGGALAEAVAVAQRSGVDDAVLAEVLLQGQAGAPLLRAKLPKMLSRDFSPQFALALLHKDLRYYQALRETTALKGFVSTGAEALLGAAVAAGLGPRDSSAMYAYLTGSRER